MDTDGDGIIAKEEGDDFKTVDLLLDTRVDGTIHVEDVCDRKLSKATTLLLSSVFAVDLSMIDVGRCDY